MVNSAISTSRITLASAGGGTCINPLVTSTAGIGVRGNGTGCILDITTGTGTPAIYVSATVKNGGSGYAVGNILRVDKTLLGSSSQDTLDFTAVVATVNPYSGAVYTLSNIDGRNFNSGGNATTFSNKVTTTGKNANISVGLDNGKYSANVILGGSDFAVGDLITVPGNLLGGITPDNDMTCNVLSAGSGSAVDTLGPVSDPGYTFLFTDVATSGGTPQGGDSHLTFDITFDVKNQTLSAVVKNPGVGYSDPTSETLTVDIGSFLGGTTLNIDFNIDDPTNIVRGSTATLQGSLPPITFSSGTFTTTYGNDIDLKINLSQATYANGAVSIPIEANSSSGEWVVGDTFVVPRTTFYFATPGPDITAIVSSVMTPTGTNIARLGNFSSNAINNYSLMVFDLPTSLRKVVYMEWVNSDGFVAPAFVQIKEFKQSGITTGSFPYWRYVTPNSINSIPDHMSVKLLTPDNYSKFTVALIGTNGKPLNQTANWALELIVYSQV